MEDDASLRPAAFAHQVGGHQGLTEEGGGIVVPEPGLLAKPTGHGYWAGEELFYEALATRADPLAGWCPAYHGTRTYFGRKHVILADLTHGMRRPCVIDIKLGTCTVAPDAAWPKRVSHLLKDRMTTTRSLGLRIIGVRTPPPPGIGGEALVRDKAHGKRLRPAHMAGALRSSFSVDGELCVAAVRHFAARLAQLLQLLASASRWRLVSSSLLFVFEPDGLPPQLAMIDFAHAYPLQAGAADHGYLYGLRNLLGLLCALLPAAPPAALAPAADAAEDGALPAAVAPVVRVAVAEAKAEGAAEAEGAVDESALVARGRVGLRADELHEGLAHAALAPWVGEWLGFDGDGAEGAVATARRKGVLLRADSAPHAQLRVAVLRLSATGQALPDAATAAGAAGEVVEGGASQEAAQEAVRRLVCDAAAPRRATLLRGLDEQLTALRHALGGGSTFQFEASRLRLECDVAAEGAPPRVRLTDFEAPAMTRDAAFATGYLDAVAQAHAAIQQAFRTSLGAAATAESAKLSCSAAEGEAEPSRQHQQQRRLRPW